MGHYKTTYIAFGIDFKKQDPFTEDNSETKLQEMLEEGDLTKKELCLISSSNGDVFLGKVFYKIEDSDENFSIQLENYTVDEKWLFFFKNMMILLGVDFKEEDIKLQIIQSIG